MFAPPPPLHLPTKVFLKTFVRRCLKAVFLSVVFKDKCYCLEGESNGAHKYKLRPLMSRPGGHLCFVFAFVLVFILVFVFVFALVFLLVFVFVFLFVFVFVFHFVSL